MGSLSASACNNFEPLFLIIGAGSRGHSYAQAVNASTRGRIGAVAEIDPFKRAEFGRKYIWGGERKPRREESFSSCDDFISNGRGRRITGVFICTLDDSHAPIIRALAPLNLHIMCEKPLALSLADCLSIKTTLERYPAKIYSIGHVLRYSPHNIRLRKLLCEEQVIGEVVSIEHTEPIGWWHFSHSYVRGNWRRSTPDAGSLLTKSCHDIDFLLWLLCSPSPLTGRKRPHLPTTVMSSGALNHFRRTRKPKSAGKVTNCLRCEAETSCLYSAEKIYRDVWLREKRDTGWPLKIVVPEIEDIVRTKGWDQAETVLMDKLAEDWDESTPDEVVRGRSWIYGSLGEITYDSSAITVHTFADGLTRTHVIPKQAPEVEKSHGGGDWGLAGAFVNAVIASEAEGMSVKEAQWKFVGCDLDEIVTSHAVVFAAEEARKRRIVVDFPRWKEEKYAAV
ncbi:hypothetical protein DV738_g1682, partial [Chaetothyriales sp. CBS 135597]